MGNHFSEAELIQLATVERRSYTDLTPVHLASDLLDCRAELAALRERAEDVGAEFGLALEAVAAERERAEMAEARVALLEGLLLTTLSAFSDGEQWWRGHSGRCSETCTDNHRCCALYAEVLAALADGG